MTSSSYKRYAGHATAIALAFIFFVQVYGGILDQSLTWDEPSYIAGGYSYLTGSHFHLNPSHPPLLQNLAALPLLFLDIGVPTKHPALSTDANLVVSFGRSLIFESGNDVEQITYWARLSRVVIGTILIGAIYLWGLRLYGMAPALFATAVATFSPNLIAHSKLATEDLGCSALMFFSTWAFWHALRSRRAQYWILCGAVTGLALISKYTALLLVPIYGIFFLWALINPNCEVRRVELLKICLTTGSVAVLVIGAGYNLSFDLTLYFKGLTELYQDYRSIGFYLMGTVYSEPKWYYTLAAFILKVPVSTSLLILIALVSAVSDRRHREAQVYLLVPASVVFVASFFDIHNLGFRRALPALPFLLLFVAQGVAGQRNKLKFLLAVPLLLWTAVETVRIHPHHLAYLNAAVGGAERGPYLLDDSNIDWGQDLPALAKWQKQHPEAQPIKLWYFGTANPASYGVVSIPFASGDYSNPRPGYYAISAHRLVTLRKYQAKLNRDIDWLEKYKPIARAGYSIYIYSFPPADEQ